MANERQRNSVWIADEACAVVSFASPVLCHRLPLHRDLANTVTTETALQQVSS